MRARFCARFCTRSFTSAACRTCPPPPLLSAHGRLLALCFPLSWRHRTNFQRMQQVAREQPLQRTVHHPVTLQRAHRGWGVAEVGVGVEAGVACRACAVMRMVRLRWLCEGGEGGRCADVPNASVTTRRSICRPSFERARPSGGGGGGQGGGSGAQRGAQTPNTHGQHARVRRCRCGLPPPPHQRPTLHPFRDVIAICLIFHCGG